MSGDEGSTLDPIELLPSRSRDATEAGVGVTRAPSAQLRGFDVLDHDDYLVCRCEDVPLSAIQACLAVAGPGVSLREIKRRLRVGMGWCQGRVCGPALAEMIQAPDSLDRNQVARPVSLAQVADDPHVESVRS